MEVVHFHRLPQRGHFSIERLFHDIRTAMQPASCCRVHVARFASLGLWRRLYNILEAPFFQGEINHVTGDVHYLTFLLPKNRTLLTVPDCASLERLQGWRREVLRLFWYTLPVRCAGLVSVISEETRIELLRHVDCDPAKVRVVHCCISPAFAPDPQPFRGERPRLLQIGTSKNKNLLRVAEALKGIPCHLQIIGRLDDEQRVALNRCGIEYSSGGDVSDEAIIAAYRACDLVVFVSTIEGFGLPIVEANAVGRPVVTSNLSSMPEVAGSAACLVDPYDPAAIRAGLRRVMDDLVYRQQLIDQGFLNAQRFTAENIARRYVELYQELRSTAVVP